MTIYINKYKISKLFLEKSIYLNDILELSKKNKNKDIYLKDAYNDIYDIKLFDKLINGKINIDNKHINMCKLIRISEYYQIIDIEEKIKYYFARHVIPNMNIKEIINLYNDKDSEHISNKSDDIFLNKFKFILSS